MDIKDYKVKIDGINIMEKSLSKYVVKDTDVFSHEIITQCIADSKASLVITFIIVNIKIESNPNEIIGKIMIGVGFHVEDFEKAFEKDENNLFKIPVELENMFKTISISTMRGVMFSEFRGTILHGAILPIIMTDTLKPVEGKNLMEIESL